MCLAQAMTLDMAMDTLMVTTEDMGMTVMTITDIRAKVTIRSTYQTKNQANKLLSEK